MILIPPGAGDLLESLDALLEEEISLLQERRKHLETLSDVLVRRDDESMERLLEEMERAQDRQAQTDLRLRGVREALAESLGTDAREMTLSVLIGELPLPLGEALDRRRKQILLLAGDLRHRHLQATMLLAESARINRMLLESLFPSSESVTTYSTGGADSWRPDTGLVDAES